MVRTAVTRSSNVASGKRQEGCDIPSIGRLLADDDDGRVGRVALVVSLAAAGAAAAAAAAVAPTKVMVGVVGGWTRAPPRYQVTVEAVVGRVGGPFSMLVVLMSCMMVCGVLGGD